MPADLINPVRGDQCPAIWQPVNLGLPASALNIHDDSLDLTALLIDVTNTGSGGLTSRLVGKLDAAGTVNADVDLNIPPYLAPLFIVPGVSGVVGKTVGPLGRIFQVPVSVEKVHYQSAIDTEVKYSFDHKMNARAGFLIYPTL